ncbi:MAG: hypothetical protein ACYS0E_14160 [Planctomycetota bacterium]|jgi:hypothetical protein
MPYEEIDARILDSLARPVEVFESALAATAEQVRAAVDGQNASENGSARDAEFGAFASGRMDTDRFASLLVQSDELDDSTIARIRHAHATLTELIEQGKALFRADVAPGGSLRDTVAHALAEIGRAYGAARTVDLARSGQFRSSEHDSLLRSFGYEHWSRNERDSAPPLVVHVNGADLRAGGLLEFLDGACKLVLVVRGAAPAAPLVPLVRPSTLVLQTSDEADLARFATWEGTAAMALMPEGAARFLHDPNGGAQPWGRLTVDFVPPPPRTAIGGYSVAQQQGDLDQLEALAAKPPAPAAPPVAVAEAAAEPADKLAAWLLDQADLEEPG